MAGRTTTGIPGLSYLHAEGCAARRGAGQGGDAGKGACSCAGRGTWLINLRWKDARTGERRRHQEKLKLGTTEHAARKRAIQVINSTQSGTFEPKREARRSLAGALDEYLKWVKTNRPKALRDRTRTAGQVKAVLGAISADELSGLHVERYKAARAAQTVTTGGKAGRVTDRPLAPATVNRELAMLKHAAGLFARWGWLDRGRAQEIREVKLLKEPPGRVRYLTDEEADALMAALPVPARPMITTALMTGMRREELVTLKKSAVDLKGKVITLTATKANRVKRVPFGAELAEVLKASMARSKGATVFVNRLGKPYSLDGVSTVFRKARERAKIEDLHLHDCRHDFATRLRRRGVGIDAIATLLGHATLDMARRYAHVGLDVLRQAVDALPSPATGYALATKRAATKPKRRKRTTKR